MKLHNPFTFYADNVGFLLGASMLIVIFLMLGASAALIIWLITTFKWWIAVPVIGLAIGRTLYAVFTGR